MTTRILPAVGDLEAARALSTLVGQLPDAEPALPVADSTALLDTLARLAAESLDELPEVVLIHERISPVPALDLIRDLVLRFPAVGVVLITADTSPALLTAAMDSGARGIVGFPSPTTHSPSGCTRRPPGPPGCAGTWAARAWSSTPVRGRPRAAATSWR